MAQLKAVVIDDDVQLSELLQGALELSGFDVTVVNDSRNAMTQLKAINPALITLDMQMPYVSGVEVLREIRADSTFDETKVIMISASGQLNQYTEIATGTDFVLSKPITLSQLRGLVQRLLPNVES